VRGAEGVKAILGGARHRADCKTQWIYTHSKWCPSDGLLNAALHGWRNIDACGKTANPNSTPVCSSSTWFFWCYSSKDHKQALKGWRPRENRGRSLQASTRHCGPLAEELHTIVIKQ